MIYSTFRLIKFKIIISCKIVKRKYKYMTKKDNLKSEPSNESDKSSLVKNIKDFTILDIKIAA